MCVVLLFRMSSPQIARPPSWVSCNNYYTILVCVRDLRLENRVIVETVLDVFTPNRWAYVLYVNIPLESHDDVGRALLERQIFRDGMILDRWGAFRSTPCCK
jgi:hypothetical protein